MPLRDFISVLGNGARVNGSELNMSWRATQILSSKSDKILIFGSASGVLAASDRKSVTPYSYNSAPSQNFKDSYNLYIKTILNLNPKLIIEVADSCGISQACPENPAKFLEIKKLIEKRYVLDREIQSYKFWRLRL
jgi:hypothetical protein